MNSDPTPPTEGGGGGGGGGVARRRPWLRWILLTVITAAMVVIVIEKIDLRQAWLALKLSRLWLVAVASAVAVSICMWGCIERLWILLEPLPHTGTAVSRLELASIHYASCAAHNVLPAPAGEVVRTVQLRRRHGYSVGMLVAAQLVEKVIDALGLGLEIGIVALLSPLPRALGVSLFGFAALAIGGAAAVIVIGWRHRADRAVDETAPPRGVGGHARSFVRRLAEGMYLVRSPKRWAAALFWSIVSDVANAATIGLVLAALGLHLPVGVWFLSMLAARMAGLVPTTPGQFGVQEGAVVLVLIALGVEKNRAFAVALLHHLAHFVPVTLAGLLELRRQWSPPEMAA